MQEVIPVSSKNPYSLVDVNQISPALFIERRRGQAAANAGGQRLANAGGPTPGVNA
jgi:hypothetical protein